MRSIYCGALNETNLDEEVLLCGWVHRRRDHGGVIFVDLRDHRGLIQVVFDPDTEATFATAERVRNEYVLRVKGRVRLRPQGTENPDMPTGLVEVLGLELEVLSLQLGDPVEGRVQQLCPHLVAVCRLVPRGLVVVVVFVSAGSDLASSGVVRVRQAAEFWLTIADNVHVLRGCLRRR